MTKDNISKINDGKDLAKILQSLTEEEKKQSYAMLLGMKIGKELAEQQPKSA